MVPEDCEFVVPKTESDEELVLLARDVNVILCKKLSDDVLKAAKKLKLIQLCCAGTENIPWDSLKDKDIYVSNTRGAESVLIAEHAIALLLALDKSIVSRHNKFQQGIMDKESSSEVSGKTLGILGLGSIGTEVAKRALAFDMRVIAIKRHPSKRSGRELSLDFICDADGLEEVLKGLDFIGGPDDLEKILKMSDFIVITLPLTPKTRGLIEERELRMMKKSIFLVNVSRAAIVDEEALYRALKERRIAGAGLDVWYKKPKYLIHKLDNVIATPHVAGATGAPVRNELKILAENISRISRGEKPINQVDRTFQY